MRVDQSRHQHAPGAVDDGRVRKLLLEIGERPHGGNVLSTYRDRCAGQDSRVSEFSSAPRPTGPGARGDLRGVYEERVRHVLTYGCPTHLATHQGPSDVRPPTSDLRPRKVDVRAGRV
jgi:hypothetical protein